jgi:acyl-CoA thioester hydrolase
MSETFPCWYPVQIRFRDLDPLAHVNNSVYFTYFEEARSYYFNRSDTVEVGVRVTHVGRTSFLMEYQIRDVNEHERLFATGKSTLVWCNYLTGRPHPVPPSLRFAFEQMEGRGFPAPQS